MKVNTKRMITCLVNSWQTCFFLSFFWGGGIQKRGTAVLFVWALSLSHCSCYLSCLITTFSQCNCTPRSLSLIFVSSHFPVSQPTVIKHRWPVLCSIISLTLLPSIFAPTLLLSLISSRLTKTASWHLTWFGRMQQARDRQLGCRWNLL